MKVIVILDEHNGMRFNQRRQSRDAAIIHKIQGFMNGEKLYLNAYSAELFKEADILLSVSEDFLYQTDKGEYCFVENENLDTMKEEIEEFIIFRWHRKYPSDFVLDILPEDCGMTCANMEEFTGNSHEKITMEVWRKA